MSIGAGIAVWPVCPQEGIADRALVVRLAGGIERATLGGGGSGGGGRRLVGVVGNGRHDRFAQGNGGDVRSAWTCNPSLTAMTLIGGGEDQEG